LLTVSERVAWRLTMGGEGESGTTVAEALKAVQDRVAGMFRSRAPGDSLITIALEYLVSGKTELYHTVVESSSLDFAIEQLDEAVRRLRESNSLRYLPGGLLSRAWALCLRGQGGLAKNDLAEAEQLAERGPMPLFLADVHLHRARLFFHDDLASARENLKKARALVEKHGYVRRMPELKDAEEVILAGRAEARPT